MASQSDKKNQDSSPDVGKQELGAIYAKSLLAVAEKAGPGAAESVVAELEDFVSEVVEARPLFADFLAAPQISNETKAALLEKAFQGRMSEELFTFLQVVASKGRLDAVREMAFAARRQLNALRHRVEVHVETASPLDEASLAQLRAGIVDRLKTDVDLSVSINPDLIGGIVMRIGDTVYDGSLLNRLSRMRQHAREKSHTQVQQFLERFAVES